MKKLLHRIPTYFILPLFLVGGVLAGLCFYTIYMARVHTYVSDDPATCINCHVMVPYYQSWSRSSHRQWATCNDCHLPHDNVFHKYAFKAMDGLYHSAVFTFHAEPQVIRPRQSSSTVIMNNCIRCHKQLNTEFVKSGMVDYVQASNGEGKACWECHRDVPHTMVSNLSASPHAIAPMPQSPIPAWLQRVMNDKKQQ